MTLIRLGLAISFVLGLLPGTTRACDFCALYTARQAQGEATEGWYAGQAWLYQHQGTLRLGGIEQANPGHQFLDSLTVQTVIGYAVNDDLTLQLNLPYHNREYRRYEGKGLHHDVAAGWGDLSLLAKYRLWHSESTAYSMSWSGLLGVKMPTADAARLRSETAGGGTGARPLGKPYDNHGGHDHGDDDGGPISAVGEHDLALGSGSWDGILGLEGYGSYHRLFVTASFQYYLRTEGAYDYRHADTFSWQGGPGYYLALEHDHTVALQLLIAGENHGNDKVAGQPLPDTRQRLWYLGPQVSVTWREHLSAELGMDWPISHDDSDYSQLATDYRCHTSLVWRF
jgi:hypothetical protein